MEEKEYVKSKKWNLELVCSSKNLQKTVDLIYSLKPLEMIFVRADLIDVTKESNKYFVYADYI